MKSPYRFSRVLGVSVQLIFNSTIHLTILDDYASAARQQGVQLCTTVSNLSFDNFGLRVYQSVAQDVSHRYVVIFKVTSISLLRTHDVPHLEYAS